MKNTVTTLTLFWLFLFSTPARVDAAMIQQPVSAEKKRAMNKLDPADIFSEVQESSSNDRKNNRKSRRRRSEVTAATDAAATPASEMISAASPTPSPTGTPEETPELLGSPTPVTVVGETGWNTPNSTKGNLGATNASLSTLSTDGQSPHSLLSLPVVLTLFVVVLATLIFVFVKMVKNIRRPVN